MFMNHDGDDLENLLSAEKKKDICRWTVTKDSFESHNLFSLSLMNLIKTT